MKRFFAIILVIAVLSCMLAIPVSAAVTVSASGEKYPTELTKGSSFGIRGIYSVPSGNKITKVQVYLTGPGSGNKQLIFTDKPNTIYFNVNASVGDNNKTLNNTLSFGKLATGTYSLQLYFYVNNSTSATRTVTKNFTIKSATTTYTTPTITISTTEKYPKELTKGSGYNIAGAYTTNVGTITSVNASLTYPNGSTSYFWSAAPGTKTFNVKTTLGSNDKSLNSTLKYGSLSEGTHTLCIDIVAKNGTAQKTYTVKKPFTIKGTTPSTPVAATITASGEQYPETLQEGKSGPLRGVYTTNVGLITKVEAYLLATASNTKYFAFSATPNSKSFDVNGKDGSIGSNGKNLNNTVSFGTLETGYYCLQIDIYVDNASTPTRTIKRNITIGEIVADNENYPKDFTEGTKQSISGTYTFSYSSGKIANVKAQLLKDADSSVLCTFNAAPNSASFDVNTTKDSNGKTLSNALALEKLPAGSYTLYIFMYLNGTSSPSYTVKKTFTVYKSDVDGVKKTYTYTDENGYSHLVEYTYPTMAAKLGLPETYFKKPGTYTYIGGLGMNSYVVYTEERDLDSSGANNSYNKYNVTEFIVWTNAVKIKKPEYEGDEQTNNTATVKIVAATENIGLYGNQNYDFISLSHSDSIPYLYTYQQNSKVANEKTGDLLGTAKMVYGTFKALNSSKCKKPGVILREVNNWVVYLSDANINKTSAADTFSNDFADELFKATHIGIHFSKLTYLSKEGDRAIIDCSEMWAWNAPKECESFDPTQDVHAIARFVYDVRAFGKTVYSVDVTYTPAYGKPAT